MAFVVPAKVMVEVFAVNVPLLVQLPYTAKVPVLPVRVAPAWIVRELHAAPADSVGMIAAVPRMTASVVEVGTPDDQLVAVVHVLVPPPPVQLV